MHLLVNSQERWTTFNEPVATYGQITGNAAESSHNVLNDEGGKLPAAALMLHCMQDDAAKMNERRLQAETLMKSSTSTASWATDTAAAAQSAPS
jgi:hypothetical protein